MKLLESITKHLEVFQSQNLGIQLLFARNKFKITAMSFYLHLLDQEKSSPIVRKSPLKIGNLQQK